MLYVVYIIYVSINGNHTTIYIGENFNRLRDIMELFNYLIVVEGKLNKVKKDIMQRKMEDILSKTWSEINEVISININ